MCTIYFWHEKVINQSINQSITNSDSKTHKIHDHTQLCTYQM